MLSNRLLRTIPISLSARRSFTSTTRARLGNDESPPHATDKKDTHNVQQDAVRGGEKDRGKGQTQGSNAATESADGGGENVHEKTKREFPEAKGPVIGMNDERGGKGA